MEEVPRDIVGPPPYKAVKNIQGVRLLEKTLVLQALVEYIRLIILGLTLKAIKERERN